MKFLEFYSREDLRELLSSLDCSKYYSHCKKAEFGETALEDFSSHKNGESLTVLLVDDNELLATMELNINDINLDILFIESLISAQPGCGDKLIEFAKSKISKDGRLSLCSISKELNTYYYKKGFSKQEDEFVFFDKNSSEMIYEIEAKDDFESIMYTITVESLISDSLVATYVFFFDKVLNEFEQIICDYYDLSLTSESKNNISKNVISFANKHSFLKNYTTTFTHEEM